MAPVTWFGKTAPTNCAGVMPTGHPPLPLLVAMVPLLPSPLSLLQHVLLHLPLQQLHPPLLQLHPLPRLLHNVQLLPLLLLPQK
jgi:hypothetical protein